MGSDRGAAPTRRRGRRFRAFRKPSERFHRAADAFQESVKILPKISIHFPESRLVNDLWANAAKKIAGRLSGEGREGRGPRRLRFGRGRRSDDGAIPDRLRGRRSDGRCGGLGLPPALLGELVLNLALIRATSCCTTNWSSAGVGCGCGLLRERLIAVEAVDHPDERPDRPDVAARQGVACDPHRPAQPIDLHMGVRGASERLARF